MTQTKTCWQLVLYSAVINFSVLRLLFLRKVLKLKPDYFNNYYETVKNDLQLVMEINSSDEEDKLHPNIIKFCKYVYNMA